MAMARTRVREDQPLVASVFDRLLDDEPDNSRETAASRRQILRELKQSVSRDLENLLNTRQRWGEWPEPLVELEQSLVNYGIPDFTGVNMSVPSERERLRGIIQRVIERFEPRFQSVKVKLLENSEQFDRTLRFRIDGLLNVDPSPEPVVFDSQLEPTTSTFEVKDQPA
jgi:type VI secretion system protein ImpF